MTVLDDLRDAGVIATLRAPSTAAALGAVEALLAGGLRAVEVTYTTPNVPEVLRALKERHGDDVLLGAGTLLDPHQAAEAAEAGAEYLVSPGLDDELVAAMRATGTVTMGGAMTPTEVMRARRLGVDVVKLFPGALGGPAHLKALRAPLPDLAYMPTGGVSADNLHEWFAAGAIAVGAGGELCPAAALASGDFDAVRERAERFAAALAACRAGV
ncbi:bifunctional 4-hydroxy-2-oxoglutarate aldolase/2-dehydro-3-deoxy-phosphogluconate aldolase [Patulibacter sp. SYSU D01012]|uniref:bifunctional 4-hydroxy-2-oxoglutarate aldolase/2-dehydro-3-deoxy-phosphogluconate aldolase n=1 Tax=Patulibacter sp. SYSU D01012 TaxID=2817381 RepID=UPI001B31415A|nr:bifunctional 4-hydroxy-2-oxoglutarate aldolase/2-dehydro-3-deoxy-phosphogluconate aldolase [Patulibacter sp. SYSU D01012]